MCSYKQQWIQPSAGTPVFTSSLPLKVRHTHIHMHTHILIQTSTSWFIHTHKHQLNVLIFVLWLAGLTPTSCLLLWLLPCRPTPANHSSVACSSPQFTRRTLKLHRLTASPPMVNLIGLFKCWLAMCIYVYSEHMFCAVGCDGVLGMSND